MFNRIVVNRSCLILFSMLVVFGAHSCAHTQSGSEDYGPAMTDFQIESCADQWSTDPMGCMEYRQDCENFVFQIWKSGRLKDTSDVNNYLGPPNEVARYDLTADSAGIKKGETIVTYVYYTSAECKNKGEPEPRFILLEEMSIVMTESNHKVIHVFKESLE